MFAAAACSQTREFSCQGHLRRYRIHNLNLLFAGVITFPGTNQRKHSGANILSEEMFQETLLPYACFALTGGLVRRQFDDLDLHPTPLSLAAISAAFVQDGVGRQAN
jgi:hypothetical protein